MKPGPTGVFMGNGGPLATVADTSGRFAALGFRSLGSPLANGFASINGLGQATFAAQTQDAHTGYFGDVDGLVTIAENTPPIVRFEGTSSPAGRGRRRPSRP